MGEVTPETVVGGTGQCHREQAGWGARWVGSSQAGDCLGSAGGPVAGGDSSARAGPRGRPCWVPGEAPLGVGLGLAAALG